jgi:ketosteroid isomerase-like protein
MKENLAIIQQYFDAFNRFDVGGMLNLLDDKFKFYLFQNEVLNMEMKGKKQFRELAEPSRDYLSSREQIIISAREVKQGIEVTTSYTAMFAVDLPHNQKAGESTTRESKTIFSLKNGNILEMREYA